MPLTVTGFVVGMGAAVFAARPPLVLAAGARLAGRLPRRLAGPLGPSPPTAPSGPLPMLPPLLARMIDRQASAGLPPHYLPKDEEGDRK